MYRPGNKHKVPNGTVLNWIMRGHGDVAIPFSLKIEYVILPDSRTGVAINQDGSHIPDEIELTGSDFDMVNYKGRVVWLTGMNGILVEHGDEYYEPFSIKDVAVGTGEGSLYFHSYLPREFDGGDMIYSEDQFLE